MRSEMYQIFITCWWLKNAADVLLIIFLRRYLQSNQISQIADFAFADESQLKQMLLDENQITVITNNTFSGLSSITVLFGCIYRCSAHFDWHKRSYVYGNQISSIEASAFSSLFQLSELNIGGNSFTTLPRHVFANLSQLAVLYGISHTKLYISSQNRSLGPGAIEYLPSDLFDGSKYLEEISMFGILLSALPDGLFSKLSALNTLFALSAAKLFQLYHYIADGWMTIRSCSCRKLIFMAWKS